MLSLADATGKWIQTFVEVKYSNGSDGFVNVILKDTTGATLYSRKITHPMWWSDSDFVRPKWGLYRAKSDVFNPSDWENFQNVQIWRQWLRNIPVYMFDWIVCFVNQYKWNKTAKRKQQMFKFFILTVMTNVTYYDLHE